MLMIAPRTSDTDQFRFIFWDGVDVRGIQFVTSEDWIVECDFSRGRLLSFLIDQVPDSRQPILIEIL